MFAGHLGAALAVARADRRVNVGTFVLAAMLLDVLLWLFVLLRWESAAIPGDFPIRHQAQYVFPYSHGLAATLGWAALLGATVVAWPPGTAGHRARQAGLIGAAVLSHWVLDAIVHVPELPLAGAGSTEIGLGLWDHKAVALALEGLIVAAGLVVFIAGAGLSRVRTLALTVLCVVCLALTVAGMTVAPPPPSVPAMARASLGTIAVVCAAAWWLGRLPASTAPRDGLHR
jgi:hypothetical protein